MKKLILLLCSVLVCAITFAQTPTAILTIFSEDGYKFYLILNGQRQNDKPETNIRVQNLTQPFYNAKIIFEDKSLGEISKNIPVNGGADNAPADVTYKIKTGKDGKQVLRYYSFVPITPNAPPVQPQGVAVYNFGTPTPVSTTTSVTQTTTTETIGTNTNINNMGVNVNGMGMNVNVGIPNGEVVHVQQPDGLDLGRHGPDDQLVAEHEAGEPLAVQQLQRPARLHHSLRHLHLSTLRLTHQHVTATRWNPEIINLQNQL